MVRTQVYFTPEQHEALRRSAEQQGMSMTELLRRLVDRQLLGRREPLRYDKESVLAFVDLGESGESRTSVEHDAVLDEALRAEAVR
jgi:hypothetical protein